MIFLATFDGTQESASSAVFRNLGASPFGCRRLIPIKAPGVPVAPPQALSVHWLESIENRPTILAAFNEF